MNLIQEAILNGLIGIVVALISVLATGVRQYILAKAEEVKATKSETEWAMLQSIGATVVTAVEQIAKTINLNGKQKYEYAINLLEAELKERGIELTDKQKKTLIESGVKGISDLEDAVVDVVTK